MYPFPPLDEELIDLFIAFLKSLALQLTTDTVKFFYNSRFPTFPFLNVAMKFYNHQEGMVRNAVRIIVLTVFKLNDESIEKAITDIPHCMYFINLSCQLRDKMMDLDQSYQKKGQKGYDQLYHCVEELQD
jgi:Uncharacterised conserved protein